MFSWLSAKNCLAFAPDDVARDVGDGKWPMVPSIGSACPQSRTRSTSRRLQTVLRNVASTNDWLAVPPPERNVSTPLQRQRATSASPRGRALPARRFGGRLRRAAVGPALRVIRLVVGIRTSWRLEQPQRAGIAREALKRQPRPWTDEEVRHVFEAADRLVAVEERPDASVEFARCAAVRAHARLHELQRDVLDRQVGQPIDDADAVHLRRPLRLVGHLDQPHVGVHVCSARASSRSTSPNGSRPICFFELSRWPDGARRRTCRASRRRAGHVAVGRWYGRR